MTYKIHTFIPLAKINTQPVSSSWWRILLPSALLLIATTLQAENVYKWTDANGVTHFTDQPPPKTVPNVEHVKISGDHAYGNTDSMPSNPTTTSSNGTPPATTTGNDTKITATDSPSQRMAKACEQARAQVQVLESKYQVSVDRHGEGKAEVLDPAARKAELEKAQEAVTAYCK